MNLLYLTIVFPIIGFLILATARGRLSENLAAIVGVGAMGLSAATAALVGVDFLSSVPAGGSYTQALWTWINVPGFDPRFALRLDGLSLTMTGVITGVGFLIHVFASWYMRGEEGYERFFSYMNLFVAAMLVLVLGDNLLFLYVGWEGVGLCSYLLIGFYYKDAANGLAARKAFVVTRVGDTFMAIGLMILFRELGTLNIQELMARAPEHFAAGDPWLTAATLLLVGGAVGKSAQLPLQTWLADAMAGPTPVSALIHAATMVTAGVYLIARTHELFLLTPDVLLLVAVIGAITLVMSGFAALVQTDIKRILAYSTMSQIGYMFLALGVGAWSAAIFHLMIHAFFKALLFLSAGAVIIACHHEQDIFKMGGLRKKIPFVYACFLVGGGALAALPFLTSGFFSKDQILFEVWAGGHQDLLIAGLVGAFLTSIYTFRLIFVAFHGKENGHADAIKGADYWLPLAILLVLSTGLGALVHQPLEGVLPPMPSSLMAPELALEGRHALEWLSGGIAIAGILLAAWLYLGERRLVQRIAGTGVGQMLTRLWYNAWGFDWLYDRVFVRPFMALVHLLRRDPMDQLVGVLPWLAQRGNRAVVVSENGQIRWYAASFAVGAALILSVMVLV
ncbi:NADH-quinone oxidoreductase subunit L [Perlucidibaca piscinae]|uniref:NADH-quinone oxidoreductase subunit L n=1 Tax=Perlucidibaca piscinae TaxID=392589 RepID=UPI0003B53FEA|nr:NADH-quinone oxidoreductase subunit L [Perlucidibaca piscinae]